MTALAAPSTYLQPTYRLDQVAAMTEAIHRDGFALVPGVLSPQEVQEMRAEIDRLRPFHFDTAEPHRDHYKCIFNRSPYWLKYLDLPGVIDLAEGTMGDECHLVGMTAWRSRPQGPDGNTGPDPRGIHTDHALFPVEEELLRSGRVKLPVMICTAHLYLSDIDIDLCPTWVLPGSHLIGRYANTVPPEQRMRWGGQELQPVLCKAGDMLFFRSEIWHCGSRNRTTDRTRYLVQIHYGHRYICHKFSPYLSFQFNPEVLALATPRQRRLLGDHRKSNYD